MHKNVKTKDNKPGKLTLESFKQVDSGDYEE